MRTLLFGCQDGFCGSQDSKRSCVGTIKLLLDSSHLLSREVCFFVRPAEVQHGMGYGLFDSIRNHPSSNSLYFLKVDIYQYSSVYL